MDDRERLQEYIARTYYALRLGMAGIAIFLPFFLLFGGWISISGAKPDSISGYYHTHLRDEFVGALVTTGTFLVLYKIFGRVENRLLNLAGAAAIGVALLPCAAPGTKMTGDFRTWSPAGHAACAVITFACLGWVAFRYASDTVSMLPMEKQKKFRVTYKVIGILMVAAPAVVAVLDWLDLLPLFWVEAVALWVFGAYWIVKTREFRLTGAEKKAVKGSICGLAECPLADRAGEGGEAPRPFTR